MTLVIDPRAGSADLYDPLTAVGLRPSLEIMPAGDIAITGLGPAGRPLTVGVEYKTVRDVLECVRSGRFADQARRMHARYEVRWLLIEGEWRDAGGGLLEVREKRGFKERGRFTYQEVAAWALTMAQRGGVLSWQTRDRAESVAWLRALYWWWTAKEFEEHRAHLQWYQPPLTGETPFEEPGLVQQVAAVLPGIGGERALAAARVFGSVREMVNADEKTWRGIDGIGPKTARRVVDAVSAPAGL